MRRIVGVLLLILLLPACDWSWMTGSENDSDSGAPTATAVATATKTQPATETPLPIETAAPEPTSTPTTVPPTDTPVPPTVTPIPPTDTPVPTNTPVVQGGLYLSPDQPAISIKDETVQIDARLDCLAEGPAVMYTVTNLTDHEIHVEVERVGRVPPQIWAGFIPAHDFLREQNHYEAEGTLQFWTDHYTVLKLKLPYTWLTC